MADIEKGLPNTKLPATGELNAVDVDVKAEDIQKGPIEVTSEEDERSEEDEVVSSWNVGLARV